jgi:glycosyltransferase involved in cell wall biosynthesis
MSRILLFGAGPLPFEDADRHYAVCKRTWQFLEPALAAGHRVHAICLLVPGARVRPGPRPEPERWSYQLVRAAQLHNLAWVQAVHDRIEPDAVAGVGALLPRRAAAKVRTRAPRWIDLFGNAMAEAQARAARDGDDAILEDYWEAEAAALAAGDRFSVVGVRQKHAAVGELGCAGRLGADLYGHDLIAVMPCAWVPTPERAPAGAGLRGAAIGADDFVILWSGGFNTWVDSDTLFEGLERAMAQEPAIHFVSTGGALPEHDDSTYARFQQRASASAYHQRFHLLGWVEADRLAALVREADVGINVDRPCYEALLGSRSRFLDWLAAGLPLVTTELTELAEMVCAAGLGFAVPPADPAALAARLIELAGRPQALRQARARAPSWIRERFSIAATTAEWRAWAERPCFAPDADRLRAPDDGEQPAAEAAELAAIPRPRHGFEGRVRALETDLRRLDRAARKLHHENKELHGRLHARNLEVDELRRALHAGQLRLSDLEQQFHRRSLELEQARSAGHQDRLELDAARRELHQRNLELDAAQQDLHQRNLGLERTQQELHQRNLELAAAAERLKSLAARIAELEPRDRRLAELEADPWHRAAAWLRDRWHRLRGRSGAPVAE